MPTHPPELQNEIKNVQPRPADLIEACPPLRAALPTHEANLRDQDPTIASHPEMFPNFELPKEKKPASRRSSVRQSAKRYLRAAPKFLRGRPAPARHSRKCQICRHPDRELIEDLYIHWHSGNSILDFINAASDDDADPDQNENNITWPAVYRHAYALGLDELRRRNLRFAFELLIEQAGEITPTSASIMAAARAYSCISDDGRWSDPPKHVIVTNQHVHHSAQQAAEDAFVGATLGSPVADASPSAVPKSTVVASSAPMNVPSEIAPGDTVGAGLSRPPFSECGVSTPLCNTTSQWQDADSPSAPSGIPSGSLAAAPSEKRGESPFSDSTPPLTGHGSRDTRHEPVLASVPPSIPASGSPAHEPSTNCHSEGGCNQHPTRLARRGGNLHFDAFAHSPDADAEIRNSANPRKNKEKTFSNR